MKFNSNYINMIKSADFIEEIGKKEINFGDYFFSNEVQICKIDSMSLKDDEFWLPTIDQLLELLPEDNELQGGAKRSLEGIATSHYHIPNKGQSYKTYHEQIFSIIVYRKIRKVWAENNKDDSNTTLFSWRHEKEMFYQKVGIESIQDIDTRTVEFKDASSNKSVGMRVEEIRYNFDNNEIEFIKVISEHLYKDLKKQSK